MNPETEKRLMAVEMALAHHEQLIDDLNEELIRQGKVIDHLILENKMLTEALKESNIKELIDCGKTRENYEEYIVNSFLKYKGVRLSNGPIEGINSRIKTLKKIYCGYANYRRFFKRVIYIINKNDSKKVAITK